MSNVIYSLQLGQMFCWCSLAACLLNIFFWQLLLLFAQCKLQRNVHVLDLPDFGLNKAELETA